MTQPSVERTGGSRAVQGCLLGAVLLFVLLLVIMSILGYQQFRENTSQPTVGGNPSTVLATSELPAP